MSSLTARSTLRSSDRAEADALAVSVENLTKVYPDGTEAVRGISFAVGEGEVFGLLGPNGAGKSTTLGMLTGTVRPSGGRVEVGGRLISPQAYEARRLMGVVFQTSTLDRQLSAVANLKLHARLWGMSKPDASQRIAELLSVVGLSERGDHPVATYSGGMSRRLEIARALLARPRLLILDEPTVGLDPIVREDLWSLIMRLHSDAGVAVIVSTHYLEEAESICDRVAIVDHGRLLALDTPRHLIDSLGGAVIDVRTDEPERIAGRPDVAAIALHAPVVRDHLVSVPIATKDVSLAALVSELQQLSSSVTVRHSTLNDVFIHLTATGRTFEGARS